MLFLYHLAFQFRILDIDAINLNAEQLTMWQAYYNLYPWCGIREDLRSARISQLIANTMGGVKSDLDDWIIDFTVDPEVHRQAQAMQAELTLAIHANRN